MISTRKLAELAGVSQPTVSRCLNDRAGISPETKERVRALARENGYIIRKQSKKTVCLARRRAMGVLIMRYQFFENLFTSQLLYTLYDIISDENYYAVPLPDCYGVGGVEKLRDLLSLNLIEGLIVVNRKFDMDLDDYLKKLQIPYIYLVYHLRNAPGQTNVVDTDNFTAGYIAAKHLIGLGHRRIATVTTPLDEFRDRTRGYQEALRESNIALDSNLILYAQPNYESCYDAVRNHINTLRKVTAVFTQFDVGAIGAMNALQDEGYQIPGDISLIGLDGMEIGEMCRPKLTSVKQPIQDLARTAVTQLLQMLDVPRSKTVAPVLLAPELIVRESTAPPRKGP